MLNFGTIYYKSLIISCFIFNIIHGQSITTENLFDFESIFQQKNIRVSERIKKEWNMQTDFVQQTYYNANKDNLIESIDSIKNVFLTFPYLLELFDEGIHSDNLVNDGIYGNFLISDFNENINNEFEIEVAFDTIGIRYFVISPPFTALLNPPIIIKPFNNILFNPHSDEIIWKIDTNADGCGLILLDKKPALGRRLSIIWEKKYDYNSGNIFIEKIPIVLQSNEEYFIIIWSYTNLKPNENFSATYSMEMSNFLINTIQNAIEFKLSQNYPNPFNPSTQINYSLKEDAFVTLKVFNVLGNEIAVLANELHVKGNYTKEFNAAGLPSGVYICTLKANAFTASKKMVLIR